MKKLSFVIILIFISLITISCANGATPGTNANETTPGTTATGETVVTTEEVKTSATVESSVQTSENVETKESSTPVTSNTQQITEEVPATSKQAPVTTNKPIVSTTTKAQSVPTTTKAQSVPATTKIQTNNHTHSYIERVTNSTCTEQGYTTYTCSCGDSYTGNETPVKGHSFTGKITKTSTCAEHGYTTYTCSCGYSYLEELPLEAHNHVEKITAPTCTNSGYTTRTCVVCGYSYVCLYTKPRGHNWEEATCTQARTCKTCKTTEGSAKGHSWKSATCTEAKICKVCKVSEGSANGHKWIDANCTTPKTCSVCNITDGDVIHKFESDRCTLCGCKKPSSGLSFYKYKEGYYLLATGSCTDTNIVIPSIYKGISVVGIYKDFSTYTNNSDCAISSDSITSIYIPDCITEIGARAFLYCKNLTSIDFDGTKEQWRAITKGEHWYSAFSTIVVTCSDGSFTYS